jgi:Asp-tRNA(Asn)/Glu-tRNA(Gln) amidotransferase A subunit family amidase
MTLSELAAAVREGSVTSAALVESSLERIERLDGPVNAVTLTCAERARDEASIIDAAIAAGELVGPAAGPLSGVPMLVKDNEDVEGLVTTFGSRLRTDDAPATRDCGAVARLRAAGAVVVGKTNLPEFALEGYTSNRLFGDTHNPWALDWSPGGSSGGSSAALAMGLVPLATGTDGGGSIRIPAAFCGLVGLKPTNGLVGRDPTPSWIDFSTKGPLTSSVADAGLVLDLLRGPAAGDPSALPSWTPRERPWPSRLLAAPRFCDHGPLPDGIQASFERAVEALESATGLVVDRIDPPFPTQLDDDWFVVVGVEQLTAIGRDVVAERADDLTPYVRAALEYASTFTLDDYLAARRRRFEAVKVLDQLLGDGTLLVCPTMCVEGLFADGRLPGDDEDGTGAAAAYNTQVTNITGHPSLSVPAGRSTNGVPFGLQITGPRFADDVVLAVGGAWEAAEPWPTTAPGFEPFGP